MLKPSWLAAVHISHDRICYPTPCAARYTLTTDKSTIEHRFGAKFYIAEPSYDWSPTFNAAPSQMLPIIRTHHSDRIELARWGFWLEEWNRTKRSHAMINARLETAAEKPMFSSSFSGRHCLVLADGYYEWRQIGTRKQPYRITLKTGEPFAMAGIYAREPAGFDTAEKNPVNFAILTTKANEAAAHIHERMPVILREVVAAAQPDRHVHVPPHPRRAADELPGHPENE
jgi:putative SOS response-associated peptidase YedK